jgi:hypothetical protein
VAQEPVSPDRKRTERTPVMAPTAATELAGTGRYDVFVSYSSSDKRAVQRIAELLRANGIRIWWDGWEMKPGDRLRDKINAGIQSSNYFLIILSPPH